jgi:hypothetical protein
MTKSKRVGDEGKWISGAIKQPGALREELGMKTTKGPRGGKVKKPIPKELIIKKTAVLRKEAKGGKKLPEGKLKLLKRLILAKTLSKFRKKK